MNLIWKKINYITKDYFTLLWDQRNNLIWITVIIYTIIMVTTVEIKARNIYNM